MCFQNPAVTELVSTDSYAMNIKKYCRLLRPLVKKRKMTETYINQGAIAPMEEIASKLATKERLAIIRGSQSFPKIIFEKLNLRDFLPLRKFRILIKPQI